MIEYSPEKKAIIHETEFGARGPRVESAEPCLLVWIRCGCGVVWPTTWPAETRTEPTLDEINALPRNASQIAVFKIPGHGEPLCSHGGVNVIVGILPNAKGEVKEN